MCVILNAMARPAKQGGTCCAAFGCTSNRNTTDYSFFRFPKDPKCTHCNFSLACPPSSPDYVFVATKAYKESGTLVYPHPVFTKLCEALEVSFAHFFPSVMHTSNVLQKLYHHSLPCAEFVATCSEECLARVHRCVALYMKVRLHHALRMNNNMLGSQGKGEKRNRKLMKLMHI